MMTKREDKPGMPLRLEDKQDGVVGHRLPKGEGTKRPAGRDINCLLDAEWCSLVDAVVVRDGHD